MKTSAKYFGLAFGLLAR